MTDSNSSTVAALRGPVPLSHLFLHRFVHDGQSAIDATCGNGNDTLLLARLVGTGGKVWGFDIQKQAIIETGRRLSGTGLADRVTLLHCGHEELTRHIIPPVQAVLFNLGYLPGGDRTLITRPETTIAALEQSLQILVTGGIVLVTIYPGHNGGADEQSCVESWAGRLDPKGWHSWRMGQTNVSSDAPYLLLIQKAL